MKSKAQENREKKKTASITQTMRSVAVRKLLQMGLMPVLKKERKNRSNNKVEIRRSLRLTRVHCTIRKWLWMIEFS